MSSSQVEKVKPYILNQKKHHSNMAFKEEYINLLRKHNINYNEKYLWNEFVYYGLSALDNVVVDTPRASSWALELRAFSPIKSSC